MKTLNFTTLINAPKEKVWNILWDDSTYRKWTSVFSEGSYAVSDWHEGSKVLFLSPEGEGMVSMIAKKTPNEFMSFKHLGEMKGGEEQPETEATKQWSGAMETYSLKEKDGGTELIVNMDVTVDHEQYFKDTFPKALESIKSLAEE
ncbi:MAG TPA: SRPBCC domain-containing protein [Saprospiraceae bacterium]|nr:SRPBCC domain-containing protein [Saprospiraceae bacterium]